MTDASVPPGWKGGFATSNPAFAYPTPDLSSLPLLKNMDNIDKLQRQQKVLWPEFSWETAPGKPDSRCFQMFAPDISRLGYDDTGRIWSIICPQQGACSPSLGCFNVEVTVTGQKGWADEPNRTVNLAAEMEVEGKVWFSPSAHENVLVGAAWKEFDRLGLAFPSEKERAITVFTHRVGAGSDTETAFPLLKGESPRFVAPAFARHESEAWGVGHLEVQIGTIAKTGDPIADDFNARVMGLFNLASGNMLHAGNVLTWNVWFATPELVDTTEWRDHAEKWRKSIDADHGSPDGPGTKARFADGSTFHPVDEAIARELEAIVADLVKLEERAGCGRLGGWLGRVTGR